MAKGFYSKLYNITPQDFCEIVKTSSTYTEILRRCGFENKGCNINTIKRRIKKENLNTNHIRKGVGHNLGRVFLEKRITLDDALKNYLILSSKFRMGTIKTLLKRFNLLTYRCGECGLNSEWKNKPLSLQLDHKNGNRTDNRIENLRYLCPNCHSQTENYAGKSTKLIRKCQCGNEISRHSTSCLSCVGIKNRKVERPSKEKLVELINSTSMVKIGKLFEVSDNAVRRWCKSYQII